MNQLNFSTVRIIAKDHNGDDISTGTGFIVKFAEKIENGKLFSVPSIVTNNHIINDAHEVLIRFHSSKLSGEKHDVFCDFTIPVDIFLRHPDSHVDLCAMPLASIFIRTKEDGIKPYYHAISMTQVPSNKELDNYFSTDDIIVVGYPNGLWDSVNNFPIFRKGILATNPAVDYEGEKEFLIDCSIFPGSSGSPVFSIKQLFNKETLSPFLSLSLLGVVYATYQHTARGELFERDIPTNTDISIPNHLGIVLNSSRIHELNAFITDYFKDTLPEHVHHVN